MFGKNKILKPENSDGSRLKVQEIFATFQGEGPFAGYPSVFVRLGGCNLACEFCDTEFDDFEEFALYEIIKNVEKLAQKDFGDSDLSLKNAFKERGVILPKEVDSWQRRNLVVITGGEPFRQEIAPLCQELINRGFLVQIETNGTIFRKIPDEVKIICSPKISAGKYHKIRGDLLPFIDAFKFIISASQNGYDDIADVGQEQSGAAVYLQPMDEYDDEKNLANLHLTKKLAQKYDAKISLQMHKIFGID